MRQLNGEWWSSLWLWRILWLGFLASSIQLSQADSINIENFLQMEADMISKLRDFSMKEEERLDQLKIQLKDWKQWRDLNINREAEYITIPQNMFHLFKKLTLDLDELKSTMIEKKSRNIQTLDEVDSPTDDHVKEVILSLVDLQYQYDLKPEDLMNGTLLDVRFNISLSLDSCFLIGKTCSEYNNHQCAIDWLNTCQSLSSDEEFNLEIDNQIYPSYLFSNQIEEAYYHVHNYLYSNYYDVPALHTYLDLGDRLGVLDVDDFYTLEGNRLCRGNYTKSTHPNLKCRYNHENSAFLKIAPLKEEVVHLYPKVVLYRDVVYDSEIEAMKNEAAHRMRVSSVVGTSTSANGTKNTKGFAYRVSENTFISNRMSFLPQLAKRMEDISDLSINFSEWWQVLNYGPGGFYLMHSDFLPSTVKSVKTQGNRILTMLFYFNEITLGGETVFPRIGLSVKPTKGLALVWPNVNSDGSRITLADHSACPVIIGEKWGFTQWMREFNQACLKKLYEYEPMSIREQTHQNDSQLLEEN